MTKQYNIVCPVCKSDLEVVHERTVITPAQPAEVEEEVIVRKAQQVNLKGFG